MRVVVVYRDNYDYTRDVIDYIHDFYHQTGHQLEEMDPDSPEGTLFCETYGIVRYPTVIALNAESIMQSSWSGLPFPTISELSYYVQ